MTASAAERAKEVAAMPHVLKWLRRAQALGKTMPKELHVYSGASAIGSAFVLALQENGKPFEMRKTGGLDQDAVIDDIPGRWDGGDW